MLSSWPGCGRNGSRGSLRTWGSPGRPAPLNLRQADVDEGHREGLTSDAAGGAGAAAGPTAPAMENEILKRAAGARERAPKMRYRLVRACARGRDVAVACRVLAVSTAGYYEWGERAPSARAVADQALSEPWRSTPCREAARSVAGARRTAARAGRPLRSQAGGTANAESTDGLGCAGCRARNGRFGGCGSGWWRWQGATVAVRACGQEETAVGRRSQACWRQAVERSARPSGVRSGAGSPAAGRGRR